MQERRDPVAEMEERRAKERELIRDSLPRGRDVCLNNFYFIDFQSLVEIPDREEIRFLPCEVAIVEYSLHSGHTKHYHKFIDPGRLEQCTHTLVCVCVCVCVCACTFVCVCVCVCVRERERERENYSCWHL